MVINIIWLLITLMITISWRLSDTSFRQVIEEKDDIIETLLENNDSLLKTNKRLLKLNSILTEKEESKNE